MAVAFIRVRRHYGRPATMVDQPTHEHFVVFARRYHAGAKGNLPTDIYHVRHCNLHACVDLDAVRAQKPL